VVEGHPRPRVEPARRAEQRGHRRLDLTTRLVRVQLADLDHLGQRVEEQVEQPGVEVGAAAGAHQPGRVVDRHRRPVGAVGGERVEHVADRHDPALERDLRAADLAG
jgi:hypothetical protein